jgi:exodeoxyribonuclease VII small subunit
VESENTKTPSFEAALGKLETVIDAMEQGEIPLSELLAKYEEGSKLLRICESRLKEAELRIEKLRRRPDGKTVLEAFEPGGNE